MTDTPTPAADDAVERMADAVARGFDPSIEDRLVRRPMPALEVVNERFVRHLRQGLFRLVSCSAEVVIEPVEVQRFSEFMAQSPAPNNFNIVSMQPLRGSALVVCEPTLISMLVDALYGGAGKVHAPIAGREFSPAEQRVIQRLLHMVCTEYGKAWKDVYPLTLAPERAETHPQFVDIAGPTEMVVVTRIRIAMHGVEGVIRLCLPYAALEPIRSVLYGAQQARAMAEDRRWVTLLTREIQAAEVTLVAELARPEVTIGQLLAMKPGDFIQFDRLAQVVASVEGTPVFACRYGTHNARYALRIDECLGGDEPHWLGGSHVH
ncbi:MAG: flagellar motor switch protein FliM [Variovorax sp.]|nr:MAG: flagellar motor switch protein FliM [Variovorax sp.]